LRTVFPPPPRDASPTFFNSLIAGIILASYLQVAGQLFNRSLNEFDNEGKRHGRWIEYYDEDSIAISSNIKFRHGYESGGCIFYHENGNRRLKWRYYKNRIRAKYYDKNGQLEQKGWSKIEYGGEETRYYWHGKWKFYNEEKKLVRKALYKNGEEIENKEYSSDESLSSDE